MVRVSAEWEPHAATWMQWPEDFEAGMRPAFADIIAVVQAYEPVHLLTSSEAQKAEAQRVLAEKGVPESNITWHVVPVDSAWMRDNGPIYVTDGETTWIEDFRFDAWGGNFGADVPYDNDDRIPAYVAGELDIPVNGHPDYVLEKGNLEFNGAGALVLNWDCQDDRNPGMERAEHETILKETFGLDTIIWAYGHTPGEGTVGHIDGTARFVAEDTIVIADSERRATTQGDLAAACEEAGLKVVRIPCPGETNYVNYLVGNGFVAAMAWGDREADAEAEAILASLFPGRDVHMIDARTLWSNGGGIHCVTNDQPLLP